MSEAKTPQRLCPKCGLDLSAIQVHEHRCPEMTLGEMSKALGSLKVNDIPQRVINTSATLRRR